MSTRFFYAVRVGRVPGIYHTWAECQKQVSGFSGCIFKKFNNYDKASAFVCPTTTKTNTISYFQKSNLVPKKSFLKRRTGAFKNEKKSYGRAGQRTEQQKKMVREDAASLIGTFTDQDIVCYTDGACSGNPGPCGAGCYLVYQQNNQVKELRESRNLGIGTNNIGELTAIGMALDLIAEHKLTGSVKILTDSRYSLGILTQGWSAKKNVQLIKSIKTKLQTIRKTQEVQIFWVGGHSNIPGNEEADRLAVAGMENN